MHPIAKKNKYMLCLSRESVDIKAIMAEALNQESDCVSYCLLFLTLTNYLSSLEVWVSYAQVSQYLFCIFTSDYWIFIALVFMLLSFYD